MINKAGRLQQGKGTSTQKPEPKLLCQGKIFKLHGDMEHADRKANFLSFDKILNEEEQKQSSGSILVCTDVASRGLDFKQVHWVLQFDLSSQIKEYVNRVGRTARIAANGKSLCFVMPQEEKYPSYLSREYGIKTTSQSRFKMMRKFEEKLVQENASQGEQEQYAFRELRNIEDLDEKQESLHCFRQVLTQMLVATDDKAQQMRSMATIAKNSSVRAYAGHSHEFRHIFNLKNVNLTEFARSYALYKNVVNNPVYNKQTILAKRKAEKANKHAKHEWQKVEQSSKNSAKEDSSKPSASTENNQTANDDSNSVLFTKRLQKSKLKDLQSQLRDAFEKGKDQYNPDIPKIKGQIEQTKKAVFTDERKLEQRKAGFQRAKLNVKQTYLSEFS